VTDRTLDLSRLPDVHDRRQALRDGSGWPRHRARKRNRGAPYRGRRQGPTE